MYAGNKLNEDYKKKSSNSVKKIMEIIIICTYTISYKYRNMNKSSTSSIFSLSLPHSLRLRIVFRFDFEWYKEGVLCISSYRNSFSLMKFHPFFPIQISHAIDKFSLPSVDNPPSPPPVFASRSTIYIIYI